ncbi:MAG: hypothetical protein P1P81_09190, partial [Desulfobulbales bacterium]|nr:hypothetical protein [Desulfobulbales bacterium]
MVQEDNLNRHTGNKFDGVAKTPIYCVVAHPKGTSFGAYFCSFGIPYVWPQSQKYATPCISKFLLSHRIFAPTGHKFRASRQAAQLSFNFLRIHQNSFCQFGEYLSWQNSVLPPIATW